MGGSLWQPAGTGSSDSGDLWAVLADVNKRLAALSKEVRELSDQVYEKWRKDEGIAPP